MKTIEGERGHQRDNDEVVPPKISLAKTDKTNLNNPDISPCFTKVEAEEREEEEERVEKTKIEREKRRGEKLYYRKVEFEKRWKNKGNEGRKERRRRWRRRRGGAGGGAVSLF